MKKIIIVNNNMKVGGVQKSLYNLLWSIDGMYDVTLVLFREIGAYADRLPPSVKTIECGSLFRYLGLSQGECGSEWSDWLKRGLLAMVCRIFGREAAMLPILISQRMLPGTYDCAISFLQNGRQKGFYGGCQEFVLNCVQAKRKVAFLHCDYSRSGANYPGNNRMIARFDAIAACSEGCRRTFAGCLPDLSSKCMVVRNCHRMDEIRAQSEENAIQYERDMVNIVMVSRLTHEKGIERAVSAVAKASEMGHAVCLHIVGGGPMEVLLRDEARKKGIQDRVIFYGEQCNPYRFMKNADLFLLTSYHEAAPLVIEEARLLNLPVLTVETTSSHEMVTEENAGWVCENSQQALDAALLACLENRCWLQEKRNMLTDRTMGNDQAIAQFVKLVEG